MEFTLQQTRRQIHANFGVEAVYNALYKTIAIVVMLSAVGTMILGNHQAMGQIIPF